MSLFMQRLKEVHTKPKGEFNPVYVNEVKRTWSRAHPKVREALRNGMLNFTNAHCLCKKPHDRQLELLEEAIDMPPVYFVTRHTK